MSKCKNCGQFPDQVPYYEQVDNETVQDHSSVFNHTRYAAAVVVDNEFQIPAPDNDIQVYVKDVTNIVVGSYLWHPAYGYLKISYWDAGTKKIGLLNEGFSGTAAPGTTVPECTAFVTTSRPCCVDEDNFQLFPFLAEDFVVPAVSASRTIQVTSTFGLAAGTNIRIGTGVYLLDQINSSLEVVIINEGAGDTPGTTVFARDSNGDLQYLLTTLIVTACSATTVTEARLVVCDGDEEHILEGDFAGQVPVLQNASTDEVAFQSLDTDIRTCTVLTAQMSITAADPTYTIEVGDESLFDIGDVLEIGSLSLRWIVTDNTTPGELDVLCVTGNPGVNVNVSSGGAVCLRLTSEIVYEGEPSLGWKNISFLSSEYTSGNSITINGGADYEDILIAGTRIKYIDSSGNTKYAYVYSTTVVGSDLLVTFAKTSDYTVVAGDLLRLYYSYISPVDFPTYFNYVPLQVGFASNTILRGKYTVNGKAQVDAAILVEGVSDSHSFIIEIPFSPLSDTYSPIGAWVAGENAGASVLEGTVYYYGFVASVYYGALTIDIDGTFTGSIWGNSGDKGASMRLNYSLIEG